MNKQSLRQINRLQLAAIAPQDKAAYDAAITQSFLNLLKQTPGDIVSVYNPTPFEVDCKPIIEALYDHGKTVCFPAKLNPTHQQMIYKALTPEEYRQSPKSDFFLQGFNSNIVDPDILLIPLVGYHPMGYRLGYGGGYVDSVLYSLRHQKPITAVGVGYSFLEISQPFFESHDEKLDVIITEKQVLYPS